MANTLSFRNFMDNAYTPYDNAVPKDQIPLYYEQYTGYIDEIASTEDENDIEHHNQNGFVITEYSDEKSELLRETFMNIEDIIKNEYEQQSLMSLNNVMTEEEMQAFLNTPDQSPAVDDSYEINDGNVMKDSDLQAFYDSEYNLDTDLTYEGEDIESEEETDLSVDYQQGNRERAMQERDFNNFLDPLSDFKSQFNHPNMNFSNINAEDGSELNLDYEMAKKSHSDALSEIEGNAGTDMGSIIDDIDESVRHDVESLEHDFDDGSSLDDDIDVDFKKHKSSNIEMSKSNGLER